MNKLPKFSLMNKDVLSQKPIVASTTDWVTITGGLIFGAMYIEDSNDNGVNYVFGEGYDKSQIKGSYNLGILPILDISSIELNELDKYRLYYPTNIVKSSLKHILDDHFKRKSNDLVKVGYFTINDIGNRREDKFNPKKSYIYRFGTDLYVHTQCFFNDDSEYKIDYEIYKTGSWAWVKVELIKFSQVIYQNDKQYLIPNSVVFSGIPVAYLNEYMNKYFTKEVMQFSDLMDKSIMNDSEIEKPEKSKQLVSKISNENNEKKYISILNDKNFLTSPTIGRDQELENLEVALAQDLKLPILVGESGVGKTAIIDELVYRIQKGDVPNFLKEQQIVEVNTMDLVASTTLRGQFEENVKKVIEYCVKNNAILFIDEIHTIYGAGANVDNPNDMSSMIKHAIDRNGLRIIGTTTREEYEKFFAKDALKRRFKKIIIDEPTNEVLYKIIEKVITDYGERNNISVDKIINEYNDVINHIVSLTKKQHRDYRDIENNPSLSIEIIDTAFGYAKYYSCDTLELSHFIDSISHNDKLYPGAKEDVIDKIKNMQPIKQKSRGPILITKNNPH